MENKKFEGCPWCYNASDFEVYAEWPEEKNWYVFCNDCGARGPKAESESEAIAAWNRREK